MTTERLLLIIASASTLMVFGALALLPADDAPAPRLLGALDADPTAAAACLSARSQAALFAGVVDLGTPGPDEQYGRGRLDTYRSLVAMRDQNGDFAIDLEDALLALQHFGELERVAPSNVNCDEGTDLSDPLLILDWFGEDASSLTPAPVPTSTPGP